MEAAEVIIEVEHPRDDPGVCRSAEADGIDPGNGI